MKKNRKQMMRISAAALTCAVAVSPMTGLAAGSDNKCGGKNLAVANVSDELLIRKDASGDSKVIGYLPSAAGVIVQSMDKEWTKVKSGEISGYVKTDYLAFGEKAEELKSVYGVPGAVASWDDVKVFSDHEDTSSIIGSVNEGEGFEVLGSSDNWVEILLDNGEMGYVAAEDVDMTLVLDTAVATDEHTALAAATHAAPEAEPVPEMEYDAPEAEYYAPEAEYVPEAEYYAPETEYYAPETEYYALQTEYIPETEYYVPETEYIPQTEYVPETEYTEPAGTDDDFNDGLTGDEYIDPSTEAAGDGTQETEAPTSVDASDIDLLAAIIYCEAGNQSEEGKIAVGQVVMNRVASSSFPNTIREVIYQSGQFTPASSGWLDQVIGSAPEDCYAAATAALNGEGSVPGCLYFNGGSGKGVQIGAHQFY